MTPHGTCLGVASFLFLMVQMGPPPLYSISMHVLAVRTAQGACACSHLPKIQASIVMVLIALGTREWRKYCC
jgi:hypothetical protein